MRARPSLALLAAFLLALWATPVADGLDAIGWLAHQSFSDGRVVRP
jgi:hypothetical protein